MRMARCLGKVFASFILLMSFAVSCSLLPVEEEAPPPPLIRAYEREEYRFTEVQRGDIIETKRITCQYSPAMEEKLSFGVGGLLIVNVYVSKGDLVKKGDLLAELDAGTLPVQIENLEIELKKLELGRAHLKKTYEIDYRTEKLKLDSLLKELKDADESRRDYIESQIEAQKQAVDRIAENYLNQLDIYDTRTDVAKLKLADLRSQLDKRRLVASIDGTVTYLKDTDPFSTSVENELFVTISDKTSSVFIVSGNDASFFRPGDKISINLSKGYHEATVIDASELGLEASDRLAYIRLDETVFDLKDRATGTILLELDRRDDVLYVTSTAVKSAYGKSIVYILNDEGIKTMREVETGFSADNKTEIVSGLEFGELVILE